MRGYVTIHQSVDVSKFNKEVGSVKNQSYISLLIEARVGIDDKFPFKTKNNPDNVVYCTVLKH